MGVLLVSEYFWDWCLFQFQISESKHNSLIILFNRSESSSLNYEDDVSQAKLTTAQRVDHKRSRDLDHSRSPGPSHPEICGSYLIWNHNCSPQPAPRRTQKGQEETQGTLSLELLSGGNRGQPQNWLGHGRHQDWGPGEGKQEVEAKRIEGGGEGEEEKSQKNPGNWDSMWQFVSSVCWLTSSDGSAI